MDGEDDDVSTFTVILPYIISHSYLWDWILQYYTETSDDFQYWLICEQKSEAYHFSPEIKEMSSDSLFCQTKTGRSAQTNLMPEVWNLTVLNVFR